MEDDDTPARRIQLDIGYVMFGLSGSAFLYMISTPFMVDNRTWFTSH